MSKDTLTPIYIVKSVWDYEGSSILLVTLDFNKALAFFEEQKPTYNDEHVHLERWYDGEDDYQPMFDKSGKV